VKSLPTRGRYTNRNGDRSESFRRSGPESQQDTGYQEADKPFFENEPYAGRKEETVANDVDWSPTELVGERDPDEIARSLPAPKALVSTSIETTVRTPRVSYL